MIHCSLQLSVRRLDIELSLVASMFGDEYRSGSKLLLDRGMLFVDGSSLLAVYHD